jgi:hypothetical protein
MISKLYYRLAANGSGVILNRCPKTEAEVERLKEWGLWSRLCCKDERKLQAFRQNKEKAERKLND